MRLGSGISAVVTGGAPYYDRCHCTDGSRISIGTYDSNVRTGEASDAVSLEAPGVL